MVNDDPFEFSILLRAVLGLPGLSFEAALAMTDRSEINSTDAQGKTALMWAAVRGDLGLVSRLLDCGADPNRQDVHGQTALHGARAGCIEKLLLAKAFVNTKSKAGQTPMMDIIRNWNEFGALRTLLKHGANIKEQDNEGFTALHYALRRGNSADINFLIKHGADINAVSKTGLSVLSHAIYIDNHIALRALLGYGDLQLIPANRTETFLDIAALYGSAEMLRFLLSKVHHFNLNGEERQRIVRNSLEYAKVRIEENEKAKFIYPYARIDGDMVEWRELFEELCFKILHPLKNCGDDRVTKGSTTDDDATSSDYEGLSDEDEEWQDAPESSNG